SGALDKLAPELSASCHALRVPCPSLSRIRPACVPHRRPRTVLKYALDAEILYEGWATDAWVPPNVVELFGRDYFDAVSGVTLNQMVSDNDLLPVMQLPHLTVLRVKTGPRQQPLERLTNASLQRLAKLPRLKCLFIDEGRFNKRGFDALDASLSLTAGRVTSMRWVDTSDDPIIVQWRSSHDLGPKKITHYSAK
ncbi:MAG: hypothetical protein SFU86_19205, partial [Pirellulaceae bacterium]|nr:hypothetical protein [Pirellulaceae bacterium]